MSKKKCHKCGATDNPSENFENDNNRKLVWEKDLWELHETEPISYLVHHIYCRTCGAVNVYKPSFFGRIKFDHFLKYEILLKNIKKGNKEPDFLGLLTPRFQRAMTNDGILPVGYIEIQNNYNELNKEIQNSFKWSGVSHNRIFEISELDELVPISQKVILEIMRKLSNR